MEPASDKMQNDSALTSSPQDPFSSSMNSYLAEMLKKLGTGTEAPRAAVASLLEQVKTQEDLEAFERIGKYQILILTHVVNMIEQFARLERAEAKIAEAVLKRTRHENDFADLEANRAIAVEEARTRAEAGRVEAQARLAEARLQKERAEDALADYRASRGRVEDTAEPEPKRVRASIQSDAPRASPSPPEV